MEQMAGPDKPLAGEAQKRIVLELKHVSKLYKTRGTLFGLGGQEVVALNNVSLRFYEGEIFGLVGESGSGKTTAGRLIVGLEPPASGEIYLNGTEITGLKGKALRAYRKKVQMIFQDPYQSLNPQLSIYESVAEPLIIHKMGNGAERLERVSETLRAVGLSPPAEFLYRYPHQLSGGQRQRVAIARAMVLGPTFLVADEPTSMLDASYSAKIFNILLEMRKTFRVTILFITHSLAAARYLCDRIGVIYKGNLLELGSADAVIRDPRHPYTRALIDAIPKFGDCGQIKRYNTYLEAEREAGDRTGCPFFTRCRKADPKRCHLEVPPLKAVGDAHLAACLYTEAGQDTGPEEGEACFLGT